MSEELEKCSLVVCSGDMDKVMAAFIIATTSATMGRETHMFFTFWGLKAIQKGNPTGSTFMERMLSVMNRGGIDRIGPSRLNFGGLGRWMFKKMMKNQGVASLPELRQTAIDLGVKMYGCQMSMTVMEIPQEKMIKEVTDCVGVGFFIEHASESAFSLFI